MKKQTTNLYSRMKHAIVATDVVVLSILDQKLHVLLIQTNKPELKNYWAVPGGLVGTDESLEDSVERVLQTKTGLSDIYTAQLETFGAVDRDPFGRVISVAYMALIHGDEEVVAKTDEYDAIKWFAIDDLPRLAYDHRQIINVANERLKARLAYTNIVANILPKYFTLTDMQGIYEIILSTPMDKRNFRKKILSLGIIKKTKKVRSGGKSRPAALYMFTKKRVEMIDML